MARNVVFYQERLGVRNVVLPQLNNVVGTVVSWTDLQVIAAHLSLHLGSEMVEENVAAEVRFELSLGVGLGHGELDPAGWANVNSHHAVWRPLGSHRHLHAGSPGSQSSSCKLIWRDKSGGNRSSDESGPSKKS